MTQERDRDALAQMLEFAESLVRITTGRDRDHLAADELLRWSIERLFEKVGEALRRVGDATRAAHPEIPWREMADMRNRMIHAYDEIAYDVVWDTVEVDLPPLVDALRRILR